jgi:hypothetical protein
MTKRAKILIATAAAALVVGGVAPMAHAERRSVGQTAYQQLTNVTDGPAGRVALRVIQRAMDAAF